MPCSMSEKRCRGACCKVVNLDVPIAWVQEALERAGPEIPDDHRVVVGESETTKIWVSAKEAKALVGCMVSIDSCAPLLRGGLASSYSRPYFHRCNNWDSETGDCIIYEDRPGLCRDYPYETICKEADCTLPAEPEIVKGPGLAKSTTPARLLSS